MFLISVCLFFLLLGWQLYQVRYFVLINTGEFKITPHLLLSIFSGLVVTVLLFSQTEFWDNFILILLFVFFIPLLLLDWGYYWLPLSFTAPFWLSGLLSTFLPVTLNTPLLALTGSLAMFLIMATLRAFCNRRYKCETFGLGDVYLLAGLCAWLPITLAALASCLALVLMVPVIFLRKQSQPFAPYLFVTLLAVL